MKPSDRIGLCSEIIATCRDEGAEFGYCAVNKLKLQSSHPHMRCFQFMLERVQDHLASSGDLGLIVADEHRELEDALIQDLAFSKEFSTAWGYRPTAITNVVDTVHFVKSRHNRLVQACDVLTYFRLKGMRIFDRLLRAWMALPDKSGSNFKKHAEDNTNQAEKAVLELRNAISPFERFGKLWLQ